MKIFITSNQWSDTHDIYIIEEDYKGKRFLVEPMELKLKEFNQNEPQEPSLRISRQFGRETNFLQALSDALTRAGFEPSTVEENKGELKATKIHLEDMRKLVFEK